MVFKFLRRTQKIAEPNQAPHVAPEEQPIPTPTWPPCGSRPTAPWPSSLSVHAHADHVANEFLAWLHATSQPLIMTTAGVVDLSDEYFCEADEPPVVDRTFLAAIKRLPGVIVQKDRRIFDESGECTGAKTTCYLFPWPDGRAQMPPRYRVTTSGIVVLNDALAVELNLTKLDAGIAG